MQNNFPSPPPPPYPERISKEELQELPVAAFPGRIHVIETLDQLEDAIEIMRYERRLGFDTETRPSFSRGEYYPVALLQLSTPYDAFLFRLNYIGLPEPVAELLADERILKVGVAIRDDIRALQRLQGFQPQGFVELADIAESMKIVTRGLRNLAAIWLGVRISKKAQLSNWEKPDLDDSQLSYASTDAWICLQMYRTLAQRNLLPRAHRQTSL